MDGQYMFRAITNWICTFFRGIGFSMPADPFSGVIIDGKEYVTAISLTGCYFYYDENGNLKDLAKVPKASWEFVNINEKHLQHSKNCYLTPGGQVEVLSWYSVNDLLDVRKEMHNVIDSTDIDVPTGAIFTTPIPATWVEVDCSLPDMTERDILYVNMCYKTPGGKVEVEGLESRDDKINKYKTIYRIVQSTDDGHPEGKTFDVIPDDWTRIVCDFPDRMDRTITPINRCYATGSGKVRVEGYESTSISGKEEVLYKAVYFSVVETTDNRYKEGDSFTEVPEGWDKIVCDFPDRTQRDTEVFNSCFSTGGGKVELKNFITFDALGNVAAENYVVLRSTDPNYSQGLTIDKIPNTFMQIECDFASLTERHIVPLKECYKSDAGRIYVEGVALMDNNLATFERRMVVFESTVDAIPEGTKLNVIPDGFTMVPCKCNCCN